MPKLTLSEIMKDAALIFLGSALFAIGFQFFFYPNEIISGGVTGIAMIINFLTGWPIGVMIIAMNVPLFLIAWKKFGIVFMVKSLAGMALSSIMVDLLSLLHFTATDNLLLACIYGGACNGAGLGLIYLAGGTTGGVDIIGKFIRHKMAHINFGTIILCMDVLVIATFSAIFDKFEGAMYAVIAMFIVSRAIDMVLYGVGISKLCYIISDRHTEIKDAISSQLDRGVTLLRGRGGFTGDDKQVIFCVIKTQQIAEVRRIVHALDNNAFCVVTDAKEVFGNGFSDIGDF